MVFTKVNGAGDPQDDEWKEKRCPYGYKGVVAYIWNSASNKVALTSFAKLEMTL